MVCCIFLSLSCQKPKDLEVSRPTVYIEEHKGVYQLIRNGEPFYIKGGAAHPVYLEELKAAGANTARIYDTIDLEKTLDKAHALGLAVAVDLPMPKFNQDPQFYENPELFKKMFYDIERAVLRHKDHPALLYWNLGNEIYYPYFFEQTVFFENYNSLLERIHELDPDHPISTTTIGANKLRTLSITWKSPQLDFISFNSFGVLSQFKEKMKPIFPIWDGPFVISEWGVNGPWEAQNTSWGVPIEETSTKKAEQIRIRHEEYIEPLISSNSLGSFVFYWGQKNEVTPTWYSLFLDEEKSEGTFQLEKIWKKTGKAFTGPRLNYILLNKKGAAENIILSPGEVAEVEVVLPEVEQDDLNYQWSILLESWYENWISKEYLATITKDGKRAYFKAPQNEGPYRLHLTITDDSDYYATANIPFYVLNPDDGED